MVEFHLSGDTEYVIPELVERCVAGIDTIDAEEVERYGFEPQLQEPVSVDTFMDSEFGEAYHDRNGEEPLISLEGDEREAQRKHQDEYANAEGKAGYIFLQVPVEMSDGSEEVVSVLVDDFALGYLEVMEYWHGEDTRRLVPADD